MKLNKNISTCFLLTLTIFLIAISGCQNEEDVAPVHQADMEHPDQEGWNSTVTTTANGLPSAIIRYGHMQRFKRRKIVEFDSNIVIDFFDEKGQHTSIMTSDRGRLNEASNNIEAFGNVVVVSDSGIDLRTEHLWWDNNIEKVFSDEFVTITTLDNDTLYGYGFEADQYLKSWEIKVHSAKAGKGFQLDLGLSKDKAQHDSVLTDSTKTDSIQIDSATIIQKDTLKQKQ